MIPDNLTVIPKTRFLAKFWFTDEKKQPVKIIVSN